MRRLPPIGYLIIAYLLLAFGWWCVLLLRKNAEAHEASTDRLALELALRQQIDEPADFYRTENYLTLRDRFERQQRMIVWEAGFLVLTILGGLYLLYRNLRREISAAEQQRNFLLSITHELKSPLAGIRLVLETFHRRRQLPDDIQEKLSVSGLTETDRLTGLVNDLLLSAKLETAYQLSAEAVDLGALITEAAARVEMKYKSARITVDVAPDVPAITGDRVGLSSVAVNLLENAAKYAQPAPEIVTTLRRGGADEVVWTVSDNGSGIPDREKRRVWAKFYRIGNEDTRRAKGTGLGLFIVRQLVNRHGGQIELEDNHPRGTTFRIHLPLRPPQ